MGASIAESKPRETGYKQDDQTYLQKQVIISSRPAFVLIGPVCGCGALRVKSECHWLLHNILSSYHRRLYFKSLSSGETEKEKYFLVLQVSICFSPFLFIKRRNYFV